MSGGVLEEDIDELVVIRIGGPLVVDIIEVDCYCNCYCWIHVHGSQKIKMNIFNFSPARKLSYVSRS
jgi:hypothetical protein